jgi:hypothetical protein
MWGLQGAERAYVSGPITCTAHTGICADAVRILSLLYRGTGPRLQSYTGDQKRNSENGHNNTIWAIRISIHDIRAPQRCADVSEVFGQGTSWPKLLLRVN